MATGKVHNCNYSSMTTESDIHNPPTIKIPTGKVYT